MRSYLFQFIIFISSKLSLKNSHKWAAFLARMVWRFSEKQRRITTTNIKLCYPKLSDNEQHELAKNGLIETIKSMFELGIIWKQYPNKIDDLIQNIHGLEHFEAALSKGQGMLLAAPHFGNWEVLNFWLSKNPTFSFLYKPPEDVRIEQLLVSNRGQSGANQITADAKGVRQVFKVLKQKHILAILPDQQPKNGQGVFTHFMGQPAYTMTLFSKIAIKTKAPVVFAVAERLADGKGFDLHFKKAPDSIYSDLDTSVQTVNDMVAKMVVINPSQYQWTYRRFSIQPDDSKLYKQP